MSMYRYAAAAAICFVVFGLLSTSCQKGSGNLPTVPDALGNSLTGLTGAANDTGDRSQATAPRYNSHATWGLWDVIIDPVTYEVEIIPLRGIQWHANVVQFMQAPFPKTNLSFKVDVPASDPVNGLFAVDVTLRHPFPTLPQFRGFDVRGGFLADGSYQSAFDSGAILADPDPLANEARLLNADGYMRWFNPGEFTLGGLRLFEYIPAKLGTATNTTATLNPYKYFSDDFLPTSTKNLSLQEVDVDPVKRGTFSTSSGITRRYIIQFAMVGSTVQFRFSYVIDASYDEPIPDNPSYPVGSFPSTANMEEVYKIVCRDTGSTAYYESETARGGHLLFDLELFDWQAPYNPSGVPAEIASVLVESPTLLESYGGTLDLTDTFLAGALPSANTTSSVASIEISDVTPTDNENQYLLFTVKSADPTDYSNPFGSPYPEGPELASYFLWQAPIADHSFNTPPSVGQVQGPDYVDPPMGPQHYWADVSDPDTGQTLTALWSVVPTGSAPSFTLPSNPDLSIDIDWSAYTLDQDYDVNLRVSDGFDTTDGTLLTVSYCKPNTPPVVGQVAGKTPVKVADTSTNYSAPINDPDVPPQVLTVMWSVVQSGNSPNYNIPDNPDYSLTQNWSTYQVGLYDVNVEVDDGAAPPVEGTLLTVTLNNTDPTLGAITGQTPVDETDTAEQYDHGTLTDPDNGQTYTYMWSLVPNGSPADYSLSPNGSNNSLIVDWCDYPVGLYDMQCRVYDGYAYGASPIFDVTRTLTVCTGNAHQDNGAGGTWPRFSYYGYVPPGWPPTEDPIVLDSYMLPRMDMDFWTRGDFAGQGVMHVGQATLINFVADSTGIHDPTTLYKWRVPGMSHYDSNWVDAIACSPRVVTSLDTSPDLNDSDAYDDNRIVIVTSHRHDRIYVLDADEPCPQNNPPVDDVPPMTILTDVLGCREIPCIAVDEDDDIWALVLESDNQYRLRHWTYILDNDSGGPYYSYASADTLVLTTQLGNQIDVFDMVVSFVNAHLFIFERGPAPVRGVVHEIDLTTSPPTYVGSQNDIFSSTLGQSNPEPPAVVGDPYIWLYVDTVVDSNLHNYNWGGDITIDHSGSAGCDPEHCRIECMAALTTGGVQVVRLDIDLNVLNRRNSTAPAIYLCNGLSSDADEGDRILVCPPYQIYDGATTDYVFSRWAPPADW